jgi:hypothetical protein
MNGWTARPLPLLTGYDEALALPSVENIACLPSGSCVTGSSFFGAAPAGEIVSGSGKSWQAVNPPLPDDDYADRPPS